MPYGRTLSTIIIVAASSSKSRTMTGMVSLSASSLALCRLCPHTQGWLAVNQDIEYCPLSVPKYCRKIVSRPMVFTRDTSIPES